MKLELIMGTAAPVSNIVRAWKAVCPSTDMYIMTIGRTPDRLFIHLFINRMQP
jgi:hypothetical protein